MDQKAAFSYRTIQRIKTEEFERFFNELEGFDAYVNHLGEVRWMTEAEAEQQHEFFLYTESPFTRLKRKFHFRSAPRLDKLSEQERELRLHFRQYLEETYLGTLRPETAQRLPREWTIPLSNEEIENIPITLESLTAIYWNKTHTLLFLVLLLVMGSILYVSFNGNHSEATGSLRISTNVKSASIFVDDVKVGYSDSVKVISNVPVGKHRLSLEKSGYVAKPKYYDVEILPDSLVKLSFILMPLKESGMGYVGITADQPNSRIFIDDQFYGIVADAPVLPVPEGTHRISVKKSGFISSPLEKVVTIYPGDTTLLIFQQIPTETRYTSKKSGRARVQQGTLGVTANVNGARIFLNGKNTGKEADYVFTNLAPGQYRVTVVRDGYRTVPPEQVVTIGPEKQSNEAAFELIKEFEHAVIRTEPVAGEIYIDGKLQGKGNFEGDLKIGEHHISFGKVPGYKTPRSRHVTLQANFPLELTGEYFPQLHILAEVSNNGNVHTENCELLSGYTFSNRGFTASDEAGPEIVFHDKLQDYFWKLGFAFPFRNPKGNDALKLTFTLPQKLGYEQKFTVKLSAAASRENYPLTLSAKVDIKIRFNGKILSYYYKPKLLEEINGMENVEWDISSYVKPGVNSLEITTTDKNNTFYYIKRIMIYN